MLKNKQLIVYSENIEICEKVENEINTVSIKNEIVERRKKRVFENG
jgi:hypothetical protein